MSILRIKLSRDNMEFKYMDMVDFKKELEEVKIDELIEIHNMVFKRVA